MTRMNLGRGKWTMNGDDEENEDEGGMILKSHFLFILFQIIITYNKQGFFFLIKNYRHGILLIQLSCHMCVH